MSKQPIERHPKHDWHSALRIHVSMTIQPEPVIFAKMYHFYGGGSEDVKYGFVIDNRKCIGCHACTVACKSEHNVPVGVNRTHVQYVEKGIFPNSVRKFSVHRCNHCEDAPCATICPTSALFTRADGIVDFDNDRCIGCKSCMQACPYDALYIDPETQTAAKCNYCAHRVDGGYEPACVVVCPVQAIVSGDLHDPQSDIAQLVSQQAVTVRKPEKNTKPSLYYVEGDAFMLNPGASPKRDNYLFSEQSGGVGHFAHKAEKSATPADKIIGTVADELAQNSVGSRVYDAPSKGILWGWEVPGYLCTKAVAVGIFIMAYVYRMLGNTLTASTEQNMLITSLVFLTATAGLLIKDLDRPDRFLYVLLRPNWQSWLVRGGYIITAFGIICTGLLVSGFFDLSLDWLVWPGLVFAVLGAIYTAFLLAQAKGRDLWQSPMASVQMLVAALCAGTVGLFLLDPESAAFATTTLKILVPLNLGLTALEVFTPHVSTDAKRALHMITHGPYAKMFYLGLLLGSVVPLVLLFAVGGNALFIVCALVLVGIVIAEYLRVIVPQMVPLS